MPALVGIAGGLLVLLAAGAGWYVRNQRRLYRSVTHAPTMTVAEVAAELGNGAARVRCTLTARAAPGPDGPLVSRIDHRRCVWQRYEEWQHFKRGYNRGRRWRKKVAAGTSSRAFALDDDTGRVLVDPDHSYLDVPRPDVERLERSADWMGVTGRTVTSGYEVRSWLIRPGDVLTAVGAVVLRHDVPVLEGAATLPPLVSTASAEAFMRNTRRRIQAATGAGAVAVAGALALAGWMVLLATGTG